MTDGATDDGETRPALCTEHTWVAVGVTVIDGEVSRVWDCERCPAWTNQVLPREYELPWEETRLGA